MRVSAKKLAVWLVVIVVASAPIAFWQRSKIKSLVKQLPFFSDVTANKTVEQQVELYGPDARRRLVEIFSRRSLQYPPKAITFIALKDERVLQVYAGDEQNSFIWVNNYPILGASGTAGPKLREGDLQVPEGIYDLTLEPNTPYHLALRLNYPNEFDLARAREDGRDNPGSAILIHGNIGSIGCLAMGDPASEELFILAHDTKQQPTSVLIVPTDLRTKPIPAIPGAPEWLPKHYKKLQERMLPYPAAPSI